MNYLKIALNAFYKSDEVYNETKEESFSESFKFFIVMAAISATFLFLNLLIKMKVDIGWTIRISLGSFVIGIILTFVTACIYHLFVKLFGGKKGFTETFKTFAYIEGFSVLTSLVLLILPYKFAMFINIIVLLWGLVIFIMLFEKYTELGLGKGIGAFILGAIATLILMGIIIMIAGFTTLISIVMKSVH